MCENNIKVDPTEISCEDIPLILVMNEPSGFMGQVGV